MPTNLWAMNGWEIVKAGGPVMYPIILCSIFAVAIFVERILYFNSIRTDVVDLKQKVFGFIKENKVVK